MAKIRQQRDAGLWYLSGAIKEKSKNYVQKFHMAIKM